MASSSYWEGTPLQVCPTAGQGISGVVGVAGLVLLGGQTTAVRLSFFVARSLTFFATFPMPYAAEDGPPLSLGQQLLSNHKASEV